MAYQPWFERLRDPRWQKKRLEIMERDGWVCRDCKCGTDTLNVHHCYYERSIAPWDYPDESLLTLCESCHERRHDQKSQLDRVLAGLSAQQIEAIVGLAKQMHAHHYKTEHPLEWPNQVVGSTFFIRLDMHTVLAMRDAGVNNTSDQAAVVRSVEKRNAEMKRLDQVALHT